jgi:hypothetical protein
MEILNIEKTKNTPNVKIDIQSGSFEIKGPSYSEDVSNIYDPILNWIDNNMTGLDRELVCELYFDVLNSVSHKKIFQILIKLNVFFQSGKKIKVKWYYDEDDEDILEMGEDIKELIELPFELLAAQN